MLLASFTPFQEYSLIMSERDSVHREIEKLQEEVANTKKKLSNMDSKSKGQDEEVCRNECPGDKTINEVYVSFPLQRRRLLCQIEMLKREIEQSLYDRDKALKECHELR